MQKTISYTYESLEDNSRQYDDIDLLGQKGVYAKYVHYDSDEGNAYIEALPRPRNTEELNIACRRGIAGFSRDAELKKETYQQILSILKLRDLRFPLPFIYELEEEVWTALVLSYRARSLLRDERGDIKIEYTSKNVQEQTDGILIGNEASAANAGLTLIGYSGCGKSSSLETVFSNYPQTIIHPGKGMTTYPQIVYLVVQCPPHSNFRGLYRNIGVAVDRALGNVTPVYAKELDAGSHGNLSIYNDRVRQVIEKFAIGIIIFDEIQHIHFDSTLENSFESILELSNQTKISFGVVGTEDAYGKIFSGNVRQARRLGTEIHADAYCKSKELFKYLVNQLFAYQWFDTLVEPDDEMIDTLYDYTRGIVDQLVGIYMYMNIDYVRALKKPKVNSNYIKMTVSRHYPGMTKMLSKLKDPKAEFEVAKIRQQANDDMRKIAQEEKRKAAEKAALEANAAPDASRIVQLKEFVVGRIAEMDDSYSTDRIEKAVDRILASDEGREAMTDEIKILRMVFKNLKASKAKKKPANNTNLTPIEIINYLEDDK